MRYFILGCIVLLAVSCHKNNESAVASLNKTDEAGEARQSVQDTTVAAISAATSQNSPLVLKAGSPEWDKKIIKTANLNLELQDYNGFNTAVHQSLNTFNAYVAQEQQLQDAGQISNTVIIKVPIDQFDNLMNHLSSLDKNVKVLDKQVSSEDVSTQIVDPKSRLETKKKLRDKYFELMGQSKKMDDVIRVQNEISAITEDIEAASGRLEYLSHQSAYSTINLKYFQVLDAAKTDDVSPSFFTSFVNAFKQGGSIITNLFLFLVNIWPLVVVGIIAWHVFRRRAFKPKPE
jgi:hypothetical protein